MFASKVKCKERSSLPRGFILRFYRLLHNQKHSQIVAGVVSGPGIANVYRFLKQQDGGSAPTGQDDDEKLQKWVTKQALAGADTVCERAVDLMLQAYGAECRSIALRHLPVGGLYIAGGLAPKLLPKVKTVLTETYLKGDPLMGDLIATVPLRVVRNESVGLLGARVKALQLLQS
eukprot:m.50713 g.50713  ORF g.50713 m.50713 type:complete len:175 (+) comp12172_c0_seq1:78-602(+)